MLSKRLGKYEIIEWLGGGRFGDVFLAQDTILEKKFALKISRMKKEVMLMLKDEARLLASLNHPNIVRFYNIDFIDEKFVMVMEYIRGKTLRDVISDQGIDIELAINIISQVLDGLNYAHKKGVLHRDLKPENILIDERMARDSVKITDFGLALFIKSKTISTSVAGTPVYMAPESWSGNYSEKSDIWSVGIILYELLTGVPPFLNSSLDGLKKKIEKNNYLTPSILRAGIPDYIEEVIKQCLEVDPHSRPDACDALEQLTRKKKSVAVKKAIQLPERRTVELELTPEQKEIVQSPDGSILVLGQAGCGKTTTLTHTVVHLIKHRIPADRILVCTFTNKAANDILNRIRDLITISPYDLWVGTFHTLGMRILRRDAERLNFDQDFTIVEPKEIFTKMNLKTGKYRLRAIMKTIENLKAEGVSPEQFEPSNRWEEYCAKIYCNYQELLRESNLLDYDDLILYTVKLLKEHEDIRKYYQNLFQYIFVDELQDINYAQYRLISLIYKKNIFFTGDEDQAIYGWRGGRRELIYQLPKDYPRIKTFHLNKSFRLPQDIIEIANNLMHRPSTAIPNLDSADIAVYTATSGKDEANFVVREIKNLKKENFRFQDIAVLYRMNYLSRQYEDALTRAHIPYTIIGGTSFYERLDIKPLLDYLNLVNSVGTKVQSLEAFSGRAKAILQIKSRTSNKLNKVLQYHFQNSQHLKPINIIDEIAQVLKMGGEVIEELKSFARNYGRNEIPRFLNEVRLVQELDLVDWGQDKVKLLTVHSAKGLEFPVVFLVDLVEDIFPLTKKLTNPKELEEERRLCYVGLTRARKKLYLLYPKQRGGRYQRPSRFLIDMFRKSKL